MKQLQPILADRRAAVSLALLILFTITGPRLANRGCASGPAAAFAGGALRAPETNESQRILGTIPTAEADLPPGTAVWIRLGKKFWSLSDFAKVARKRIAKEDKAPPPANAHVQITLDPDTDEAFAELVLTTSVGLPSWVVTINRELKVTGYKKTRTRG